MKENASKLAEMQTNITKTDEEKDDTLGKFSSSVNFNIENFIKNGSLEINTDISKFTLPSFYQTFTHNESYKLTPSELESNPYRLIPV